MSESLFTRKNVIRDNNRISFGCSHTWGVGVNEYETWCYLLGSRNFGQGGISADFIARKLPEIVERVKPRIIYILWPDWTRYEIVRDNILQQSMATDKDRIFYMKDDQWLKENFSCKSSQVREFCKVNNIKLVDLTLYNLIPWIDRADKWPLSKLGHHYSPQWHKWVAEIFKEVEELNESLELLYD